MLFPQGTPDRWGYDHSRRNPHQGESQNPAGDLPDAGSGAVEESTPGPTAGGGLVGGNGGAEIGGAAD